MSSVCLFWFCDGQLARGIYSSEEGSTESDNSKKLTPLLSRWRNSILHQCKWNMDLDEKTGQEKSLIIAIDGCWSFVMYVVRLCQSCFCRLPFSSSLFNLCCQRIANLDRCRAFRKASIPDIHRDWAPNPRLWHILPIFLSRRVASPGEEYEQDGAMRGWTSHCYFLIMPRKVEWLRRSVKEEAWFAAERRE